MGSIRKALGAVKDQTTISIAKVSSNVAPELDVAVVKATSHDDEPAEERHVREIFTLTHHSRPYIAACVAAVSRRLARTRDWIVAVKALMLVHRLLNEGDPAFQEEILYATRRGTRLLNLSDFRDEAHSSSWDQSAFVRTYALYLDQRLECSLFDRKQHRRGDGEGNASNGRGHDSRSSYESEDYDRQRERRYYDDERGRDMEKEKDKKPQTPLREMQPERLLVKMQQLQQLLDRFLACRPTGKAKSRRMVFVALYPIVKESFQLYADLCEILAVIVDRFHEMEYADCVKAFDAYTASAKQIDELLEFYKWSKDVGVARSSEYPEVDRVSEKLLETLEESLREKALKVKSLQNSREKDVVVHSASKEEEEEEIVDDMNSIKALPAPEGYEEKAAVKDSTTEKPAPSPQQPQQTADLVDLRDAAVTADSQGNSLALALFSTAGSASVNGDGKWEAFGSSNDEPQVTSAWQTPAAEKGKADWEVALVETASNLSKQKAALGGGFDPVLLEGMYDQGVVRQHVTAQVAGGSASSVALPGLGRCATPVLALPAPDGSVKTIGADPFEASLAVPPPSYVQMAEIEKKQQLVLQEQQLWQQYTRDGMQGPASFAKLSMGYNNIAQPMPYGMPPVSGGGYYHAPY